MFLSIEVIKLINYLLAEQQYDAYECNFLFCFSFLCWCVLFVVICFFPSRFTNLFIFFSSLFRHILLWITTNIIFSCVFCYIFYLYEIHHKMYVQLWFLLGSELENATDFGALFWSLPNVVLYCIVCVCVYFGWFLSIFILAFGLFFK